jgi:hypothetical protein
MDSDHLAERQPSVSLLAIGALQLKDPAELAFLGHRAFRDSGHAHDRMYRSSRPLA